VVESSFFFGVSFLSERFFEALDVIDLRRDCRDSGMGLSFATSRARSIGYWVVVDVRETDLPPTCLQRRGHRHSLLRRRGIVRRRRPPGITSLALTRANALPMSVETSWVRSTSPSAAALDNPSLPTCVRQVAARSLV
jgi:hypothetical protein